MRHMMRIAFYKLTYPGENDYQLLILLDPGEIIVLLCHSSSNALQSKLKIAKHCESSYKDLSKPLHVQGVPKKL